MVAGHVVRNGIGVEGQASGLGIALTQAGRQAGGSLGIGVGEGRRDFKPGGFVVDIIARIGVDGHQRQGAQPLQALIELPEQLHIEPCRGQVLLHQGSNSLVDREFGQPVGAHRPRVPGVVIPVADHQPDQRARARRCGWKSGRGRDLDSQRSDKALGQAARQQAGRRPGCEQCRQDKRHAEHDLQVVESALG